jgi:hypothetical protein
MESTSRRKMVDYLQKKIICNILNWKSKTRIKQSEVVSEKHYSKKKIASFLAMPFIQSEKSKTN